MNEIVVLSAGKILNSNLYPFFKNKYQNKLINEYRQNIFKNFDNRIYFFLVVNGFTVINFFHVHLSILILSKNNNLFFLNNFYYINF